jgi:hypothetical protein
MKKLYLVIGIVSLLVFPIMTTMSCDDETANEPVNPFVGTWEAVETGYRDVFTANTITVYDTSGNIYWKATYTYNDTHVTVVLDTTLSHPEMVNSWGETCSVTYRFQDGYLYFNYVQLIKCS